VQPGKGVVSKSPVCGFHSRNNHRGHRGNRIVPRTDRQDETSAEFGMGGASSCPVSAFQRRTERSCAATASRRLSALKTINDAPAGCGISGVSGLAVAVSQTRRTFTPAANLEPSGLKQVFK
jgi:hypothetical protein